VCWPLSTRDGQGGAESGLAWLTFFSMDYPVPATNSQKQGIDRADLHFTLDIFIIRNHLYN